MIKILACNAQNQFVREVLQDKDCKLIDSQVTRFKDGEISVQINESVRGDDVFVLQSTEYGRVNDNIMEFLIVADALRRSSVGSINLVCPYFYYSRQDRQPAPRTPITARTIANLIECSGVDRVLTMDLHAGQIQGFFNIPLDNLYSWPVVIEYIQKNFALELERGEIVITSPDVGGIVRARSLAKRLGCEIAIVDKRREKAGASEVMNVIGSVSGKICIIVDDIADSAGTICNCATALKNLGAKDVLAYVTHGVFSDGAMDKIGSSQISSFLVSNTIPQGSRGVSNKVKYISATAIFTNAMKAVVSHSSVSKTFF